MNPYFTYPEGFIPGTLIRAEEVNDLFMQLEVAFDGVDEDTPLFTGDFVPMTFYGRNKSYRDPVTGNLLIAVVAHTSTTIEADLAANKVRIAFLFEELTQQVALATEQAQIATEASEVAVGLVNYKGEYRAMTTYLTGESVSFMGSRFIAKKTNLGIEPVDGMDWLEIKASGIYRNFLAQSTPIVLTNEDAGGYILIDGTVDLTLTLPDATTLNGLRDFTFKNTGNFPVTVNDFSGNYLFVVSPETSVITWASDSDTSAGVWAVYEDLPDFLTNGVSEINARPGLVQSNNHIAPISSTQSLKLYGQQKGGNQTTYLLYAVVVTNTAGVITYGDPVLLASDISSSYYASVATLTATSGVVVYQQDITQFSRAIAFNVSGTTITFGQPITVDATIASFQNITALSSTTAVFVSNTTTVIRGAVLTVSGLTITVGVVNATLANVNGIRYTGISALSSTLFAILYPDGTNTLARTVTVTGAGAAATLTPNATVTVASGVGPNGGASGYALSAYTSTALLAHYQTSGAVGAAVVLTVSGTAITVNTPVTVSPNAQYQAVSMLSATNGVNVYRDVNNNDFSAARAFTISGTTITQGTAVTLQAQGGRYQTVAGFQTPAVAAPNATTALVGYNRDGGAEYVQPINVTGSTITANASRLVYERANTFNRSPYRIASLSETRAIYLSSEFADDGRSTVLFAYLMDVSGNNQIRLAKVEVGNFSLNSLYASICPISATQAIAFYQSNLSTAVANVITMSGSSLSVGAQVTVNAATTVQEVSIGQLGVNSAVVHYRESTTLAAANVLTVSGTTITVGAKATVTTNNTSYNQIAVLSGTQAIAFYSDGNNNRSSANLLTISGTAITVGAAVFTGLGGGPVNQSIIPISSTRALACENVGLPNNIYTIDVIANALQVNPISSISLSVGDSASIAALSANQARIIFQASTLNTYELSIEPNGVVKIGDVIIQPNVGTPYATLASLQAPAVAMPNAEQVALVHRAFGVGQSGFYETRKILTQAQRVQ